MIKRIIKDVFSYGVINALKSIIPILFIPILTSYLSPNDYGMLSIIEVSILLLMPFISLNINGSIGVELYRLEKKFHAAYISEAIFLSFVSFCFLFIVFFILSLLIDVKIPSSIIRLLPVFCMLRVTSSVVDVLYQVKHKIVKFALFTLLQTVLDFSFSLLFVVFFNYGYIGRLEGTYISYFIITCLSFIILYKFKFIIANIKFKYYIQILKFGLPLIPHAISGTILAMSDRYFILYFNGEESVGFYTVAYQVSAVMLLVGNSITLALSPILYKILNRNRRIDYDNVIKIFIGLSIFILLILIIVFYCRDLLFNIFVNESFYSAKKYFPYLLLGFCFQSIYSFFSIYLFYVKRTVLLAKLTTCAAILNIILNFVFIKLYSVIGVAYSTALTWSLFSFSVILIVTVLIKKKNFD